jgi:hypothetical protein
MQRRCRFCKASVEEVAEGFQGHSRAMKLHVLKCFLAPRQWKCTKCSSNFVLSTTLSKHMSKHTEGEEIDKFAVALGLVHGVPVTSSEIG